jgi:hypothetical protein
MTRIVPFIEASTTPPSTLAPLLAVGGGASEDGGAEKSAIKMFEFRVIRVIR